MARPKGSKNRPKSDAPPASGGPGHNSGQTVEGLDDDRLHALTRHHMLKRAELVTAEKNTKAARMNYDKIIKADLGASGLADIKLLEELANPENQAASEKKLQTDIERRLRVARWAGMSIGEQGDLFGEDKRSQREKGFESGKRDGMEGKPAKPQYSPQSEGEIGYLEGYSEGQKAIMNIKKTKAPADAPQIIPGTVNEGNGPDDFDANSDPGAPPASGEEEAGDKDSGGEGGGGNPWPDEVQISERNNSAEGGTEGEEADAEAETASEDDAETKI